MSPQRLSRSLPFLVMALIAQGCAEPGDEPSDPPPTAEPTPADPAVPAPAPTLPPAAAPPTATPPAAIPGEPPPPSTPEDEVDLAGLLSAAGAADITHGTQVYQRPPGAPQDEREQRLFVAFLSGGQEVPPVTTAAEGAMALIVNRQRNQLRFVLRHQVSEPTVAHLHLGSAGENGDIAVALPRADRVSEGTLAVTPAQVEALLAGRIYVNVHSKSFAKGEIRGQILRPGETVFVASLRGAEEVPPVVTTASAQASLILSPDRDQMRFRIAFSGLTPTLAHVHRGIAGVNGMVVEPLAPIGAATVEGSFPVNAADVQDLALRQWYLNLHSAANPMGELRGQVLRPGESVFAAALSPEQEVPPVTSTNTASAMVVLGSAGAKFLYVVKSSFLATVAHIHKAPAGSNGPVEVALDPVGTEMSGIRDLGPARRADIEGGLWYVNLHSAANPMGELRGQLFRPGENGPGKLISPPPPRPETTPHAH